MNTVVYEMATERIIAEMEKGKIPWRKPWTGTGAYNYKTGRRYMILNQMLLLHEDGYVTFKQCQQMGGKVKKGAKAETVFEWFCRDFPVIKDGEAVRDEDGEVITRRSIRLTYSKVFWVGDCEGLPVKQQEQKQAQEIATCEDVVNDYVSRSGIRFVNDVETDRAYYSPKLDKVQVPTLAQFKEDTEYYSTVFHELTHSTGHKSRLNRFEDEKSAAFGSATYSKEELVAEIGAATIMSALGHEIPQTFRNSVAYIQSWISALKNDKKLIVSASARAEKAVNLILNLPGYKRFSSTMD